MDNRPTGRTFPATVYVIHPVEDIQRMASLVAEKAGLGVEFFNSPEDFLAVRDPAQVSCLVVDVHASITGLIRDSTGKHVSLPPMIVVADGHAIPLALQATNTPQLDPLAQPLSVAVLEEHVERALETDRENHRKFALALDVRQRMSTLTLRELEIMKLLAKGESTKHIAHELSIRPKTAENHRARVLTKMGVDNPTQLACLLTLVE